MNAANLQLTSALSVSTKQMKWEHGFFAMNTPKLIHIPNMANPCCCSIHHEWECAGMKVLLNRRTKYETILYSHISILYLCGRGGAGGALTIVDMMKEMEKWTH